MNEFYGEHIDLCERQARQMPAEDAEQYRATTFAVMSGATLASVGTAVGYSLIAEKKPEAGAAVLEMANRVREPAIGRWAVLVIGIVLGACAALAIYTGFKRPMGQSRASMSIAEKAG